MSEHTIMVVDDNSATRRMVRNALQRSGHHVIEAPDGKTARALMKSDRPRVVLQDLMLPDADGFVLVGELRDIAGAMDVSILAFSGFVSELDEARVSRVGFDDIIAKPIAPSRLVPLIEAHLPAATATESERFGVGRRVVIADDDPMQRKLAQFRLGRLGFEVEAVADGRAALAAMRRSLPAVVVSDVMMPELDGFGLAMEMRKDPTLRRLPLLLITSSYVEGPDRDLARRAGATDLVARTPDLTELLDALRVVLDDGKHPDVVAPEHMPEIEAEHNRRVFRQLERQVSLNTGLAKRCSALASELTVLTGISEAVLMHSDIGVALDDALAECFDAGGIAVGALYLMTDDGLTVRSIGSAHPLGTTEQLLTLFGRAALLDDVLAGRAIMIPNDVAAVIADDLLARTSASALLLVPLMHLGKSLGALLMATRARAIDHGDWRTFAAGVATQITQALTLARAYSDREVAERSATQQAALLNALVESAPDLIVQVDIDGTIRFTNGPIRGKTPAELIGGSWFDLISETERAAFESVAITDTPTGYETQGLLAKRTYSIRLGPVRHNGKVIAIVVVARDVTEKKQGEIQLMLADRMASVGTLAAGVAHEINNPLAAVIANLDMAIQDVADLAERTPLPGDLLDELKDARTAADRVREIVRDLKIFSRAEEDRHGSVDVQHVLESTLRMAWNELRHRAKVVKSYAAHLPLVDVNESRLGQVFLNLIINAAHAIPEGKYETNEIRITTSRDAAGNVVISIGDTGGGIPVELRSRLFTPFFTTKPAGVGTGLGLAISHKIITAYNGTITFESTVGKGTEFRVTLPIAPPTDQDHTQRLPKIVSLAPLRRGSILVIDDEESIGLAIKRFLSPLHDVTTVTGARAAIALFESGQRYDVIFCDLMMPQTTGMELHADMTARFPDQVDHMVFVTGGAFTTAAREFLDTVDNRRVEKPFDLKVLRGLVNDLIR